MTPPPDGHNGNGQRTRGRDRALDDLIVSLVAPEERVLDLGCGQGDLLLRLRREKAVRELGIEICGRAVAEGIARGLTMLQGDLEEGLALISGRSFDVAVLNQVLPMVRNPLGLIEESRRVAGRVLVTIPNFVHWKSRAQIFFGGRLPVTPELPFQWHETPHVRYFTVSDLRDACRQMEWEVMEEICVRQCGDGGVRTVRSLSNLRSTLALFLIRGGAARREGAGTETLPPFSLV